VNKALISSKRTDWRTPKYVLDVVRQVGKITLDPCASPYFRRWFADVNWTEGYDNYRHPGGLCFMNPPYGRDLWLWVCEYKRLLLIHMVPDPSEIIMLVPARPGSRWFDMAWRRSDAYCFWNGRIKFEGAKGPAPFPSIFFYRGSRPYRFCDVFSKHGIVGVI
jgi:hypothetical protein